MFKELHDYLYHLAPAGGIPLKMTGIVLGALLLGTHVLAWLNPASTKSFLKTFPRNYPWAVIILTIDFLWGMLIMANMDMGEFFFLRKYFLMAIPCGYVLVVVYVREFLAVRALGSLMLLAAGPVLAAAFLQPQTTRLLLPILAYAWIIIGMFFVGMPFLMRDWITWTLARPARWLLAVWSGIAYGAAMLILAVTTY